MEHIYVCVRYYLFQGSQLYGAYIIIYVCKIPICFKDLNCMVHIYMCV